VSIWAKLVILIAVFVAGGATGVKWQIGVQAKAELEAKKLREADARQQRQLGERKVVDHLTTIATLNRQLGAARETIARLPGRDCLDPSTVRLLNHIGDGLRTAPGSIDDPPETAPSGGGLRFSTDRDAATALATCRAAYAEVSGQLNKIIDLEEARRAPR